MPPRHGKSELVSKYFPAWYLSRFPEKTFMLASYSGDFAGEWGRKVRELLEQHPELRVRLNPDSKAANRWNTDKGGGMYAAGVEGGQTGRGAHCLVIDDPIKNAAEAYSESNREAIWQWWQSTAYTRLEPDASVVVVMTRWHEDDLAGRLLRESAKGGEQWTEIRFPAIAEGEDVIGRVAGDPLFPLRYGLPELERIRLAVGPLVWSALYQQTPRPAGMRLYPETLWRFIPFRPSRDFFDYFVASWDCSFKDLMSSSYVVGQAWGFKGARAYLVDSVRGQWDFTRTCQEMLAFREAWPNTNAWYVEDKANGTAIITSLRGLIPGILPVEVHGSKQARAAAVQPFAAAGNVVLLDPNRYPFVRTFIEELRDFPQGKNDDQVDAYSQALERTWLAGGLVSGVLETSQAELLQEARWGIA